MIKSTMPQRTISGIRQLPGRKRTFLLENIMERRLFLKLSSSTALGGALAACGGGSPTTPAAPVPTPPPGPAPAARIVIGWNQLTLEAIRTTRAAPPMAARNLAVVHSAMFDAWAAYDKVALGTRPGATLRRPLAEQTPANQARAYSFAAYAALVDQFPTQKAVFDSHMATLGYRPADASRDPTRAEGVGTLAAAAVLAHAHQDGSNQLGKLTPSGVPYADYTGYVPKNPALLVMQATARSSIPQPSFWQPLTFRDAGAVLRTPGFLAPFWGKVTPFALSSGAQLRPPPPAAAGSPAFVAQARQLVEIQAALTAPQKAMAEYWAGGATGELPSGYWSGFGQFVARRDNHSEADDIKLFFVLSNALFDAGIAAWDAKRAYESVRPITAIRYLYSGQTLLSYGPEGTAGGLRTVAGESWMPFHPPSNPTPPHPDHVSGHSTYSSASATVLKLFTGSDAFHHGVIIPAGSSQFEPAAPQRDIPLRWDSFTIAAHEAGASRLYAGIHFEAANLAGRALGEQVGAAVFQKAQAYWLGRA